MSITTVRTASGENQCFCYYVNIILPHKVVFKNLLVTGLPLAKSIDALIRMDIISIGSFLFTTDKVQKSKFLNFPPLLYLPYPVMLKKQKREMRGTIKN